MHRDVQESLSTLISYYLEQLKSYRDVKTRIEVILQLLTDAGISKKLITDLNETIVALEVEVLERSLEFTLHQAGILKGE